MTDLFVIAVGIFFGFVMARIIYGTWRIWEIADPLSQWSRQHCVDDEHEK